MKSFYYDVFARQVTATDGRTNTTTTAYNDLGQVAYIENAVTTDYLISLNSKKLKTML